MNKIEFSDNFDVIIALNSDLPDKSFFDRMKLPVLASDGAAILLYKKEIIADKVIGDLDSFYAEKEHCFFDKKNIIHISEQETNDFEKCLIYAANQNYKNILIVGFHGGLLEHTLNNWSVFSKYSKKINLCIYDKERYGFSVSESCSIELKINEIISLIPQPFAKIYTKGLKWQLNYEQISLGFREGARNLVVDNLVEIEIINGEILLFTDERLPYSPNKSIIQQTRILK